MFVTQLFKRWTYQVFAPGSLVRQKYEAFKELLQRDQKALEYMAELEDIALSHRPVDFARIESLAKALSREVEGMVEDLVVLHPLRYSALRDYLAKVDFYVRLALLSDEIRCSPPYVARIGDKSEENLLGGKGNNLSRIKRETDYPVPPGFVITTRAFHYFLEVNNLRHELDALLAQVDLEDTEALRELCDRMQQTVLAGEVPVSVAREVEKAMSGAGLQTMSLALRSSAVGEDSLVSFAGQYMSVLNVDPASWTETYKAILASKYAPNAVAYRIRSGMADTMVPMAVVVMGMVHPRVSGIMYTPGEQGTESQLSMIPGYGVDLADGRESGQQATVSRQEEVRFDNAEPVLAPSTVAAVARVGQGLEAVFDGPQDVEWAVDQEGEVVVLQSRPLPGGTPEPVFTEQDTDALSYAPEAVLCQARSASPGRATGPVHLYDGQPEAVPPGSVLVVEHMTPDLSVLAGRICAVVAAKGSATCHFASVAREQRLPAVYGASCANQLDGGRTVSVDSHAGVVLNDAVVFEPEPREREEADDNLPPVQRKLAAALEHISPLHLTNPDDEEFSLRRCRSMHDIIRFTHEAGVKEMFDLIGGRGLNQTGVKRLVSDVPLVLHVLDVERGLQEEARKRKEITPEDIVNRPMRWLWAGLADPAVAWNPNVVHYDWDAYNKSQASFVNVEKSTMFSSYAVLGDDYLHGLFRFGFHFAVVDCVVGEVPEHNYLHVRFKGGGGLDEQRLHRLELLRQLLTGHGFSVKTTGDLLEGVLPRQEKHRLQMALHELGIILGKTVQLDMRLHSDQDVADLVEEIQNVLPER